MGVAFTTWRGRPFSGWVLALTLGCCSAAGGCASLPPGERVWSTVEEALPLPPGAFVDRVEPFTEVLALERGFTYVSIDAETHRRRGAWFSVNGGAWTTAAMLRRGDRVDVAFTRTPDGRPMSGSLSYTVAGPSRHGWVRLIETRWYLDGYPPQEQPLRVWPYGPGALPPETPAVVARPRHPREKPGWDLVKVPGRR
ncbi:MAG: hypothetical protein AAFX76_09765 [Planctomycetota bacterium]